MSSRGTRDPLSLRFGYELQYKGFTTYRVYAIRCITEADLPLVEMAKACHSELDSARFSNSKYRTNTISRVNFSSPGSSHRRDESEIFLFSCLLLLFSYNRLAPIPLGVGGLVTNLLSLMRNFLRYLIAILGYEISIRKMRGRIRKKLLRDLRK